MTIGWEPFEMVAKVFMQQFVVCQQLAKPFALPACRQVPEDEQPSGFYERTVLRDFFDGVASIVQCSFFAVDEGDAAVACPCIAITRVEGDVAGFLAQASDVNGMFLFTANHDGQFIGRAVEYEVGRFG